MKEVLKVVWPYGFVFLVLFVTYVFRFSLTQQEHGFLTCFSAFAFIMSMIITTNNMNDRKRGF